MGAKQQIVGESHQMATTHYKMAATHNKMAAIYQNRPSLLPSIAHTMTHTATCSYNNTETSFSINSFLCYVAVADLTTITLPTNTHNLTFSEFWCISGSRRISRFSALICSCRELMLGIQAKQRMYSRVKRGLGSSRRNCFSREATSDTLLSSHENSPQLYSVSSSCLIAYDEGRLQGRGG